MSEFVVERPLRFSDCDPAGVGYFPAYLNLLNGVVEDFWDFVGFPLSELIMGRSIGVPTVLLECHFQSPALFGAKLRFALFVTKLGRSSLHMRHEVFGEDGAKWNARQVVVATSLKDHRSIPWPEDIRVSLQRQVGAAIE